MFLIVVFYRDTSFSHIIDTNKLSSIMKQEVELNMQNSTNKIITLDGYNFFNELQQEAIMPLIFPIRIDGAINV